MMKPYHAITKCDSTPPRPFSRAFHPINLVAVAAEVTRLKLHQTARFDDPPAFVPTEINLIRPNLAKSGQKTSSWRGDRLSPQPPPPRAWTAAVAKPSRSTSPCQRPQPATFRAQSSEGGSKSVQPSPTQSNSVQPSQTYARPTFVFVFVIQLAGRASASAIGFKLF